MPCWRSEPVARALGAALVLALLTPGAALAGCSDPPAPGVEWRRCIMDGLTLAGVDLTGAAIRDSRFARADLDGAAMTGTNLTSSRFVSATLRGTVLDGADLTSVDMTNADLTGASLKGAHLRRTRFFGATLRDADLTDARIEGADFLRTDLSGTRWVDGRTICAEGSSGRCIPAPQPKEAGAR
jgi:uncharacterized protein YjbI with pentapeptide repeats